MKKHILTIFILCLTSLTFAQKVKIKKGIAFVDGKEYLKVLDGCKGLDSKCSIGLLSSNEEVIYMDYRKVMNPSAAGYNYWNINFLDFEKVAEIQASIKKIIKILYTHNFLNSDGTVSEKAVKKICLKYGKKYS